MPIMKQKLVQDFFEADEIKKLITKKQLDIDPGVEVLNDMLKNIRDDIDTMDKEAKTVLDNKNKELGKINAERKKHHETTTEVNDTIDQRNLDRKKLLEDFDRCKRELLFIQNIAYEKGWFD